MTRIYYVYDANCGWCYAFSPVINEAYALYRDRVGFETISGGMVLGTREGPIGLMSDYILKAIPKVEDFSGIRFGTPYIEMVSEGKRFNSSMKPSMALSAFKQFLPQRSPEFAAAIQQAAFVRGEDLNLDATYFSLLPSFSISLTDYATALNSPETRSHTLAEFHFTGSLGVTGFPTVVGKRGEDHVVLARGFMRRDDFLQQVETFLK